MAIKINFRANKTFSPSGSRLDPMPTKAPPVPVMGLWNRPAYVEATLGRTSTKKRINLMLANTGPRILTIALAGTVLKPDDSEYQRLFVAGSEDCQTSITLQPGAKSEVYLVTCCMDQCKSLPSSAVEYRISGRVAPPRMRLAAEKWTRHSGVVPSSLQGNSKGVRPTKKDEKFDEGYIQEVCWGQREA